MNVWTSNLKDFSDEALFDRIDTIGDSVVQTFNTSSPDPWPRFVRIGHESETEDLILCEVWVIADSE